MRLPVATTERLLVWAREHMERPPDVIIGSPYEPNNPYLNRWYVHPISARREPGDAHYRPLIGNKFGVYVHQFLRSDLDEALHDHPRHNISIVLDRGYWEHIKGTRIWRGPGCVVFRRAETAHRIELEYATGVPRFTHEAISLFITGPRVREWGFHCSTGWIDHLEFYARSGGSDRGGCSE